MANIRPNQLPPAALPVSDTDIIIVDQGVAGVRKATVSEVAATANPLASQTEATVGTNNTKTMTPLRVKESIASEVGVSIASNAQGAKADTAVQSVNGHTGTSVNVTKGDVGLGNADNTSDLNKPVSTATQTALNLKANAAITISAGTGLTGGGDLSANRNILLNSASIASLVKADSSVQTVNGVAPVAGNVSVAADFPSFKDSRVVAAADSYASSINFIMTAGYAAAGDGGGALYKRVAVQPTHAGKFQSADGAWWELASVDVNPLMFGATGNGIIDDTVAVKAALDFFRNPPIAGLPGGGSLARRNYRRRLDLVGRIYGISSTLDIDMCFGIHITNGTLAAVGTWSSVVDPLLTASNVSANNFDNFSLSHLTIQCSQKCSGITLQNSSLYQINNVYVYGWGATGNNQSFGFKSLPAGYSSSATIHNMIILPYTTWLDERARNTYTGTGMVLGHNDCIITGCEIAAGYRAVQFSTGAAAIQFNDNHTWIANPGQNPGVEINGNFGIIMDGNYFDSHPIWLKGNGYYSITITNNFFLSGSPSPSAAVILESAVLNQELKNLVITGNTGSGGMGKVVEVYSPASTSFSQALKNVVVKDNPISTSLNGGYINPTCTEGTISVFVGSSVLDGTFRTRVLLSDILLVQGVANTNIKCTFGVTQNDVSMADKSVTGYFYNTATGYLHFKMSATFLGFVTVHFKVDIMTPAKNAVVI